MLPGQRAPIVQRDDLARSQIGYGQPPHAPLECSGAHGQRAAGSAVQFVAYQGIALIEPPLPDLPGGCERFR
jgi:hypothetical protein